MTLIVGGVTFSMVHWSNTSHVRVAHTRPGKPTIVPVAKKADFAVAKREGVLQIAARFVDSAVRRRHVERSYDLATPALKSGYTRKSWATQDIPVQPYPLDLAKYQLKGSFADSVWLQVAVFPDRKHKTVPAAVFDLVLKPFGHGASRRWLVDSWAPAGYQGVPSGPLGGTRAPAAQVEYRGTLSGRWLLVPVSAFALALILVALVAVRGWWRGNRALKRYKSGYL